MGCFNVSGTVSKLSIGYDDKVVLIPLISKQYKNDKDPNVTIEPSTSIISNDMSRAFYDVRFLPIVGFYDSYGRIENIEKNDNTKYIEQYFGISIERFIDIITTFYLKEDEIEDVSEYKRKEILAISGMFEHYDVFHDMVKEGKNSNNAYENMYLTVELLEIIGFECQKDVNTNDSRYSMLYTHPNFDNYIIHSDGTFTKLINKKTKEELKNIYTAKDLISFLKRKKCKVDNVDLLMNNNTYNLYLNKFNSYFKLEESSNDKDLILIEQIKKLKILNEKIKNKESSKETKEEFESLVLKVVNGLEEIDRSKENLTSKKIVDYWDYLRYSLSSESLVNDLSDFMCFNDFFTITNNIYFPASSGTQDGDHMASKKLLMSINRKLKNLMNEN